MPGPPVVALINASDVRTSPHVARVHEVVRTEQTVYEVVGQAVDLHQIAQAASEASKARPTR